MTEIKARTLGDWSKVICMYAVCFGGQFPSIKNMTEYLRCADLFHFMLSFGVGFLLFHLERNLTLGNEL